MERTETGVQPAGDGWFIVNAAEIGWFTMPGGGTRCAFESPAERSPLLGTAAAVAVATDSPQNAYADYPPIVPVRSPWPLEA